MSARIALKAETIKRDSGSIVLAADTVVACGTRVLDKPETITQAEKCLHKLSGRSHKVLGAFVLIGSDNRYNKRLVVSSVTFKRLDKQEIRNYQMAVNGMEKQAGMLFKEESCS